MSASHPANLAQYEEAILKYQQTILEINQAFQNGQLSSAEMAKAGLIYQEYELLITEFEQLSRQGR